MRAIIKYIEIQQEMLTFIYILIFTSLLSVSKALAQQQPYQYNLKVIYKLHYQPDSTDKESIKNEFETLLIGNEQSAFCASLYLIMDSAMKSQASKGNSFGPPRSFFETYGTQDHLVVFKSPRYIITFDQVPVLPVTLYKYSEPKSEFKWNILSDTVSIDGIHCQKAETDFGNRKWIAWFAPSIPISDGPYKFCGLPGLILKINDSQQYWNFYFTSIVKIDTLLRINFLNQIPQTLKNKEEYFSKKRYLLNNRFQLMMLYGARFSNEEEAASHFKKLTKEDNNWIELYNPKDGK